jgi:hypothetical protein
VDPAVHPRLWATHPGDDLTTQPSDRRYPNPCGTTWRRGRALTYAFTTVPPISRTLNRQPRLIGGSGLNGDPSLPLRLNVSYPTNVRRGTGAGMGIAVRQLGSYL